MSLTKRAGAIARLRWPFGGWYLLLSYFVFGSPILSHTAVSSTAYSASPAPFQLPSPITGKCTTHTLVICKTFYSKFNINTEVLFALGQIIWISVMHRLSSRYMALGEHFRKGIPFSVIQHCVLSSTWNEWKLTKLCNTFYDAFTALRPNLFGARNEEVYSARREVCSNGFSPQSVAAMDQGQRALSSRIW